MNEALGVRYVLVILVAWRAASADVAWRVHVKSAPSATISAMTAWATRDERPTLFIDGRVDTTGSDAVITDDPHVQPTYDELIATSTNGDATEIWTVAGEHAVAKLGDARYYDAAPGIVAVARSGKRASVSRLTAPTWRRDIDAPLELADAAIVGWIDRDDAVLALEAEATQLFVLRVTDGSTRALARIAAPVRTFAVASRARTIAELAADGHVDVRSLDTGRVIASLQIAPATSLYGRSFVGFDGTQLWLYHYEPPRGHSDMLGIWPWAVDHPQRCTYEVYDARRGMQLRTLASSQLASDCSVRALIPTLDGGAISVAITGARTAEVVKYSSPP